MEKLISIVTNKKFDIAFCTFLCFIAPCVAAPGDAQTSTVTSQTPVELSTTYTDRDGTEHTVTSRILPGESVSDLILRHKVAVDAMKEALPPADGSVDYHVFDLGDALYLTVVGDLDHPSALAMGGPVNVPTQPTGGTIHDQPTPVQGSGH